MTTRDKIESWFAHRPPNATHMIIATDTYDYVDYPVYVTPDQDAQEEVDKLRAASMTRVMEVYNYSLPLCDQLREERAWHI